MEEIKEVFTRLKSSEELGKFKKEHKDAYLASFSTMSPPGKFADKFWQIDYYLPKTKKMTSFVMKEIIEVKPNQDILQKGHIKEIDMEKSKLNFETVLDKAGEAFKKKLNEEAQSIVVILHNNEHLLWAITFVTSSMKIVSIKIDATTGKIVDEKTGSFGYAVSKS